MKTLAELYRDALEGDRRAQNEFYRIAKRVVFAALRTFPRELLEDCFHQTLLYIFGCRELYSPAKGCLENYLITLTRNNSIDFLRKNGTHRYISCFQIENEEHPSYADPIDWTTPEDEFCSFERKEFVERAIARLPESYKKAIISKFYLNHRTPETASFIDKCYNEVGVYISRAIHHLRNNINPSQVL